MKMSSIIKLIVVFAILIIIASAFLVNISTSEKNRMLSKNYPVKINAELISEIENDGVTEEYHIYLNTIISDTDGKQIEKPGGVLEIKIYGMIGNNKNIMKPIFVKSVILNKESKIHLISGFKLIDSRRNISVALEYGFQEENQMKILRYDIASYEF